jgi:cell division protein FtsB
MPFDRRTFRLWLRRIALWGGLTGFALFAVWFVFGKNGLRETYRLKRQYEAQAAEIERLEETKQQLAEYLKALVERDELALETAARYYGLVAPDEIIYDIKIDSTAQSDDLSVRRVETGE